MYQNLSQYIEEKEIELLKLTYGHADLPVIDFLRTAIRQAGELTAKAILEEGWTSDNEENRKMWLNKE